MSSVIFEFGSSPKFALPALPPPPRKRAAINDTLRAPSSPENFSHTIWAWANSVHPGSPVTPASRTSLPRAASFTSSPLLQAFRSPSLTRACSRRRSVSSSSSGIPSTSFFHFVDVPRTPTHPIPTTPFPTDIKFDFTAFGYASIFVDVPVSASITPEIYKPKNTTRIPGHHDLTIASFPKIPAARSNGTGVLDRLLGNKSKVKPRARTKGVGSRSDPHVSGFLSASSKKHRVCVENSAGSIEKQERELYAGALPITVKQEAQMRRAMEGGSLEFNIQKVAEEKAKGDGTATKVIEGVETPYRDGQGGVWWDQEEECEFAHLLASNPPSAQPSNAEGWVTFNYLKEYEKDDPTELPSLPSSQYTDLYHSRPLVVVDEAEQLVRGCAMRCASVAASIVLPSPSVKPSNTLLAIPSRPNRGKHLQPGFLQDVIVVPLTPSALSAISQTSRPPHSPARATRFIINTSAAPGPALRQRIRSRSLPRRQRKPAPPPLKIVPICPVNKLAVNVYPEEDKELFPGDSPKPGPITTTSHWSKEVNAPRPLLGGPGDSDAQMNSFALADVLKKSRRLGGFFRKGERNR
jgi:hypothetical protein